MTHNKLYNFSRIILEIRPTSKPRWSHFHRWRWFYLSYCWIVLWWSKWYQKTLWRCRSCTKREENYVLRQWYDFDSGLGLAIQTLNHNSDKWISGADNPPQCACNKGKGDGKKSKDKHNKDKSKKPNKQKKEQDHPYGDGQSAGAYGPGGSKGGKAPTKHKKNKH